MSARPWWCANALLELAARVVPAEVRSEWRDEWRAELWQIVQRGRRAQAAFSAGALRHALWLRRRGLRPEPLLSDVRLAARGLLRAPAYVIAASLTLALGIGANATVFSVLNGLLLRAPGGIAAPETLMQLGRGESPSDFDTWSAPHVRDLRSATGDIFVGVAAWSEARGVLGRGEAAQAVPVQLVSGEYFDVLGVRASAGRLLRPEDDGAPGSRPVLVLSHSAWRTAFAADPSIVGREVTLSGRTWQVVGVAAADFAGVDPFRRIPAAWAPLSMQNVLTGRSDGAFTQRGNNWLWVFARRAPGVGRERAEAVVGAAHARINALHTDVPREGILFADGVGARPGDRAEALRIGAILMATVLLVLWIACANIAGLSLARGATREGEMAVRVALGAGRARLLRQLLLESVLVAALGGLLAAAMTVGLSGMLPALLPLPVAIDFAPDLRVVAFAAAVALATVLAFGVAPAIRAARTDPLDALRTSGIGRTPGAGSGRMRRGLVVVQVALAFVLLSAAALLVQSVRAAYIASPGFRTAGVLAITIDARGPDVDSAASALLRSRLLERVAQVPGVTATGSAAVLPIAEPQPNRSPLSPAEMAAGRRDGPPPPPVYTNTVDGGFFRALGLPVVAGRVFDDADAEGADVLVVNERFVERFFPEGNAVGATVLWAGGARIIGVVADAAIRSLGERPPAAMYLPARRPSAAFHLLAAGDRDDAAFRRDVLDAIADLDPALPILRTESLDRLVGASLTTTRLTAATAAAAGAVALLLAVIGLYGVIACTVADRKREFGLRFALGARHADVLRLVFAQGLRLAGTGIVIGLALSLAALRLLDALLFGVHPRDPVTLSLIAFTLTAVTLLATSLPATRAAKSAPARTLN